eukprot:4226620-Amphidinium_carterae.1
MPITRTEDEVRAELCKKGKAPTCEGSGTKVTAPTRASDLKGIDDPSETKSEASTANAQQARL